MVVLSIRHTVKDYASWKLNFDGDPLDRAGSGVSRYRILREMRAPDSLNIELEFDDAAQAQRMLERLQQLWQRPEVARTLDSPVTTVLELAEEGTPRARSA